MNKRYIVTGGAGFIGSHLVDELIHQQNEVIILDNLLTGYEKNINKKAIFYKCDLRNYNDVFKIFKNIIETDNKQIDGVFHLAAIARTPWCIDEPILAYDTNVMGTLHVLECARHYNIKRVVMTSSNVIYAFWTPYRSTKEALESLARVYNNMYKLSVVCLRNSNVYGQRQSEEFPSPNVFAALRKSRRENGYIVITGDGEQSRDFTHVYDIVSGHIAAMNCNAIGEYDLCTGKNTTMNEIAKYFNCEVKYIEERPGDIKHIYQNPQPAQEALGWSAKILLDEGMKDFFLDIANDEIVKKQEYLDYIQYNFHARCIEKSDINEHLPTLYKYAKECDSILECGVRGCVSSWAFSYGLLNNFSKKRPLFIMNDIDNCTNSIKDLIDGLKHLDIDIITLWKNDLQIDFSADIGQDVDMTFIDTWHIYGQLRRELKHFCNHTKKYIIMHDTTIDGIYGETMRYMRDQAEKQSRESGFPIEEINKGLIPAIEEFLAEHPEWIIYEKYNNNNGLTILARTNA